jgi:hypothetical protein
LAVTTRRQIGSSRLRGMETLPRISVFSGDRPVDWGLLLFCWRAIDARFLMIHDSMFISCLTLFY